MVTRLHPGTKLFVLDTNVLMHDPTSLFRFEEHDIFVPMATLEELDDNKKGMSEVVAQRAPGEPLSRRDRHPHAEARHRGGIAARAHGDKQATGRLFLQTEAINGELPARLRERQGRQPDPRRGASICRSSTRKRQVILVSKDINMRIKARALGLAAEDYFNDKVLEDTDLLYTGVRELPADFWDTHGKDMESWQQEGRTFYRVHGPLCSQLLVNEFVYQEADRPFYAQVREVAARPRSCRRSRTMATSATTSGASPRATASRTSRSTC